LPGGSVDLDGSDPCGSGMAEPQANRPGRRARRQVDGRGDLAGLHIREDLIADHAKVAGRPPHHDLLAWSSQARGVARASQSVSSSSMTIMLRNRSRKHDSSKILSGGPPVVCSRNVYSPGVMSTAYWLKKDLRKFGTSSACK